MSKKNHLVLLTVFSLLLSGCNSSGEDQSLEVIRPVMVHTVNYYTGNIVLTFSGFSKSEKTIETSFRVPGKIDKLPIRVGDKLGKGELIAKLDDEDYILKLKESEAALQEAVAEARNASASYNRFKSLYENDAASRNELDSARAAHEAAKANVEKERSNVDLARKQLGYTSLYTVRGDCYVSTKNAEVAENVITGQKIATLSCGALQKVEIAVPETSIYDFYEELPVDIIYSAFPGQVFKGKVWEVGVAATGGTTYPVTVILDKPQEQLRAGMAVKVYIPITDRKTKPALTVPAVAVGEDNEGNYVYVFKGTGENEGIAEKRTIKIGEVYPDGFEITEGIQAGEQVITAGIRYLSDGRKVKLTEKSVVQRLKGESN